MRKTDPLRWRHVWVAVAQTRIKLRISSLAQCHRGHKNTRGSSDSIGNSFSMRTCWHHPRLRYKPKSTVRGLVNACGACGRHCTGGVGPQVVINGPDDMFLSLHSDHRASPHIFLVISTVTAYHPRIFVSIYRLTSLQQLILKPLSISCIGVPHCIAFQGYIGLLQRRDYGV